MVLTCGCTPLHYPPLPEPGDVVTCRQHGATEVIKKKYGGKHRPLTGTERRIRGKK